MSPVARATSNASSPNGAACFGHLRAESNNPLDRKTLKGKNAEQNRLDKLKCKESGSEPIVNGGYPAFLADAPHMSSIDPWGYYNRTATSYAAFKVYQGGGYAPYYYGNANQWPSSAAAAGYSSTPSANSVGVLMVGAYGHLAWVESVNNDGTIDVSQYDYYNAGGSGSGHYSKMRVSSSMYSYFISFN